MQNSGKILVIKQLIIHITVIKYLIEFHEGKITLAKELRKVMSLL